MNDTKYPYANVEPHSSFASFLALGSHGRVFKQSSIILGHDSPVAHLKFFYNVKFGFLEGRSKW